MDKYADFSCLICGRPPTKYGAGGEPYCEKHFGKQAEKQKRGRYSGRSKFWEFRDKENFGLAGYAGK